jgi:hypothetical protein
MTFNNSCFFTAIANLLEDHNVYVEDSDIIQDSLIPYIFEKEDNQYSSGYQIQDIKLINDYLKQYILGMEETIFEHGSLLERKQNLIQSLLTTPHKKIVSLYLDKDKDYSHATIFVGMEETNYTFKNMIRKEEKDEVLKLTYNQLLSMLSNTVRYASIHKIKNFEILDKRSVIETSLNVLNQYQTDLFEYCKHPQSYEDRLISRDKLFRPLLLNYIDISKILNKTKLHQDLLILQGQYLSSFKNKSEVILNDYLNRDLLEKCILDIKSHIANKKQTTLYHGSKVSGIKTLYPSLSIHGQKYVYLSTKKEVALVYTVNAIESFYEENNLTSDQAFHPWYSYGFSNGKLQLIEYYENALEETYKGKTGYVYLCEEPIEDKSNQTNIFCAITTRENIRIKEEICIKDIYKEFLKLESEGIILIKRYKDLSPSQLQQVKDSIKQSILENNLIQRPNYNYSVFLQKKFPYLFD